jgi:hypothetical protein
VGLVYYPDIGAGEWASGGYPATAVANTWTYFCTNFSLLALSLFYLFFSFLSLFLSYSLPRTLILHITLFVFILLYIAFPLSEFDSDYYRAILLSVEPIDYEFFITDISFVPNSKIQPSPPFVLCGYAVNNTVATFTCPDPAQV